MSDTIHTVIAGAGYVGKALINRLLSTANVPATKLTALVNTEQSAAALTALNIHVQQCNFDQPLIALDLPSPCNVVYLIPPSRHFSVDYRLQNFLEELTGDIRRFIYISTTGVYGDRKGRMVNETTPVNPGNSRSARRVNAEKQSREFCEKHDTPVTIFRVPGIYGPDRLPLASLQHGEPVLTPEDSAPGNRIHRDDLVTIIRYALESNAMNGVINVGDGNPMSSSAFKICLAELAGYAPPEQVNRNALQAMMTVRRWSYMRESRRVDTTLLQSLLPEPLRYTDPEDGLRASLLSESP